MITFTIPPSPEQARSEQTALAGLVMLKNQFGILKTIAGVDVGYDIKNDLAHASIALLTLPDLRPIEQVQEFTPVTFPYVPGLLSFREIPAILNAFRKLKCKPDLLMVDGQGIAHPRRLGIAAHLGVLLDMPSIGVAKSRLTGSFEMPGEKKGSSSALMDRGQRIGTVLRSRDNVSPLFISPGHKVDIHTATDITLQCITRFRLPEPTRLADKYSKLKTTGLI